MHERIAITGADGVIGTILQKELRNSYELIPLKLPEHDIRDFEDLRQNTKESFAIIHLAWDTTTDNMSSNRINPDNSIMFQNVYKAALENGVNRVIMASSVHADAFYNWSGPELLSPHQKPHPDSPYGAHKVFMENLGELYAKKGLKVVCIRFGGINPENQPPENAQPPEERSAWLSHRDCTELIKAILESDELPDFTIVYAISNNDGKIHDTENSFGWIPQDK